MSKHTPDDDAELAKAIRRQLVLISQATGYLREVYQEQLGRYEHERKRRKLKRKKR